MRLAALTKTQQSSPSASRTKTTQAPLSCCCTLDAVIRNDSRLRRCAPAARLGCSSNVPAPVPAERPRDPRDLSVVRAATKTLQLGLVSLATQPSLFFFFSCPSPPTSPCTAFTTPGQMRYYSIVANNRSLVFKSNSVACICGGLCVQ